MHQSGYNQLLDDIYGSVLQPALWVSVMERIADAAGGNTAWLSQVSIEDGHGTGLLARCDPELNRRYFDYYRRQNPLTNRTRASEYMSHWKPGINTLEDHLDMDALAVSEYYNDFLRPQRIHTVLMIDLAALGVTMSSVNIHRDRSAGAFQPADLDFAASLHPHLERAFKLGGVFAHLSALSDDKTAALEDVRDGVFILDAQGCIRHANRAAQDIVARHCGLTVAGGKLAAQHADAARKLSALIGAAASRDPDLRRGGSLTLETSAMRPRLSITVAPLRPDSLPVIVSGPSVLVTVTDLAAGIAVSDGELQALFALTAAEMRVVRALPAGASPRETAAALGVSLNTVRSQLASVFHKTETTGQTGLLLLLMRLVRSNLH